MPTRRATFATLATAAILVAGAAGAAGYYRYWISPAPALPAPRAVSVKRGDSLKSVARELEQAGVVRSALVTRLYAQFAGLSSRIKPGDYAFRGGERIPEVMLHLVNGDSIFVAITVPEGLTLHQIAEKLEQSGLVCDSDFEQQASSGPAVKALGLGWTGAEGFLFPATYKFSPTAGAQRIVVMMLKRFFSIWTPAVEQARFDRGLTSREIVTLASIIEKEARVAGERPLIAGVFYNRLRLGMPLGSDPTAQYNREGIAERALIAVHTRSDFNTYEFAGLPPGPIANPGWSSINAALHPAHSDYLYFVARADGTHIFSHTLAEHERAIASLRKPASPGQPRSDAASLARRVRTQ